MPKRIEDVDTHVAAYTQHNKQNERRASGVACRPLMETTKNKKREKRTDPSPQKKELVLATDLGVWSTIRRHGAAFRDGGEHASRNKAKKRKRSGQKGRRGEAEERTNARGP